MGRERCNRSDRKRRGSEVWQSEIDDSEYDGDWAKKLEWWLWYKNWRRCDIKGDD